MFTPGVYRKKVAGCWGIYEVDWRLIYIQNNKNIVNKMPVEFFSNCIIWVSNY